MRLAQISAVAAAFSALLAGPAVAQQAASEPEYSGLLAGPASRLADKGITFDLTVYDFLFTNPSFGLDPGNAGNSAYWVTSADVDLDKLMGWKGGKFHLKETFFNLVYNNDDIAGQFGDNSLGYQTTYIQRGSELSQLTLEQSMFNGKVNVEFGRTHPFFYFTPMTCETYNTCYQDVLYFNAGYISPLFSVWGGRAKIDLSPTSYFQVGTFSLDQGWHFHSGWDWGRPLPDGMLSLAEYGFDTAYGPGGKYTGKYVLTGYYNSGEHASNNTTVSGRSRGLFPDEQAKMESDTSGIVFNSTQIVWREDGGSSTYSSPRTLAVYTGAGYSFDTTVPVLADIYMGFNLHAPLLSRPNDKVGMKFRYEAMNDSYNEFMAQANKTAGGSGAPFEDKFIVELNAHTDLFKGMVLESVAQYIVNPNSYYNPYTAERPDEGFYLGATLKVPLGKFAGIAPQ
ncbi:carbohydrate porin [Methyloceanibacter sp. wino2]|uniref:carbohydrate porin n=1 Tax=Methyloceanibacter sp. wino2 TaxID=2170729 RepID=UPI000D3EC4A4|nr:carbohydrate porin [Methyloceanibacter sp. wino2]